MYLVFPVLTGYNTQTTKRQKVLRILGTIPIESSSKKKCLHEMINNNNNNNNNSNNNNKSGKIN